MKKSCSLLLALAMAFALFACQASTPTESPKTSAAASASTAAPASVASSASAAKRIPQIIVGTSTKITTANRSEYNFDVISGTLSQLAPIWMDENTAYHPLLCDFSTTDSKVWTLKVRDGMKWHDGAAVTAGDIKFTLEYLDTQEGGGGYAKSYKEIRVKDDKTIELELASPNPRHLANLTTLRILPKHIYDGIKDYKTVENKLANIGCGPYKFVSFDSNARTVEFAAHEGYPEMKPAVDKIILKLYDNADTMYMALKAGEIDMVYSYAGGVSPTVIDDLKASGKLTLLPVKDTSNTAVFVLNNNTEPGSDANIRKAIACAIDYDKFRELFGSKYSVAATAGFIPVGTLGYIDTPVLKRDLDKAKAYLKAAGCTDSNGDGIVEYKGNKLSIKVTLRSDKPEHARYAELLKANLAQIGIEIVPDVQETAVFREITEKKHSQTAVITKLTAFGMGQNQGLSSLYLWGETNMSYGQVFDKAYKALLDRAGAAATLDEYKTAAADIQKYYAENMPANALFWDSYVQAYSSKLDGFVIDGTFGFLNVQTWMNLKVK